MWQLQLRHLRRMALCCQEPDGRPWCGEQLTDKNGALIKQIYEAGFKQERNKIIFWINASTEVEGELARMLECSNDKMSPDE